MTFDKVGDAYLLHSLASNDADVSFFESGRLLENAQVSSTATIAGTN